MYYTECKPKNKKQGRPENEARYSCDLTSLWRDNLHPSEVLHFARLEEGYNYSDQFHYRYGGRKDVNKIAFSF